MRIGVTLPLSDGDTPDGHVTTFAETAAFARLAEAAGLDSIWIFDHVLFRSTDEPDSGIREGWTTFSALAPLVPRVELGSLVMCSSFRNPALMAKMAATLDDLADGRLTLGLGSGWHDPEYEAFGWPADHKVGRFAEDLEITARLLRGERVTYAGTWLRTSDAVLVPPPGRRVPLLVAAKGERMLRLTASWADAWNTAWFGRIDDRLRTRLAAVDAACAAVGRDPATLRRTIGVRLADPGTGSADDASAIDAEAPGLAAFLDELAGLGVDDAIIWSISKSPASVERIAEARRIHLARWA
ncbi:MAG: LLM class flavin-dependent oxidoreductase [Chloroflexi bacterium]|nr:LLM class flavin-dependent oxidoreductase [Chloroflexota bacterium]